MPIIVCITIILVMYFLLRDDNKNIYQESSEYITCNGCGDKVNISYEFCPHCSDKLKEVCTHCKKTINVNWRYCPYCRTTKENR